MLDAFNPWPFFQSLDTMSIIACVVIVLAIFYKIYEVSQERKEEDKEKMFEPKELDKINNFKDRF